MAGVVADVAKSGCNEEDGIGMSVGTGTRTRGNTNRLEGLESKIDITTPDKTNKTPILIIY